MADLMIDYGQLHLLATTVRSLKADFNVNVPDVIYNPDYNGPLDVPGWQDGDGASGGGEFGNGDLYNGVREFYSAWHQPFVDAMSRLDDLAQLFDSIATKWFDMDSDFAQKANSVTAAINMSEWQSQQAAYEQYLRLKDKSVSYQYTDENGNVVTASIPLWDPNTPAPPNPGDRPSATTTTTNSTTTNTNYDSQGRPNTETSTVTSPSGLTYSETTTYTYGDPAHPDTPTSAASTITHSDGTSETMTQTTNADGTVHVSDQTTGQDGKTTSTNTVVTPVTGNSGYTSVSTDQDGKVSTTVVVDNPTGSDTRTVTNSDGSTTTYTGDAKTDWWDETPTQNTPATPQPQDAVPPGFWGAG